MMPVLLLKYAFDYQKSVTFGSQPTEVCIMPQNINVEDNSNSHHTYSVKKHIEMYEQILFEILQSKETEKWEYI